MRQRTIFVVLVALAGLLFIRLGLWQLSRRAERIAHNQGLARSSAAAPVEFTDLPADTAALRYRRARLAGIADYDNELLITNRSRDGSPGVHLYTPVRVAGRDTAVLVNRGWVYAPDGTTPAPGSWQESDTVSFEGFAGVFADGPAAPPMAGRPRAVSRATLASVRARVPYPIDHRYLVALSPGDSGRRDRPARVQPPAVNDQGPHLGYALQWFAFAAMAIGGAVFAWRSSR